MYDILAVQFGESFQTTLENLLGSLKRNLSPHKTEKVFFQIPEHEDTLVRDGVMGNRMNGLWWRLG